MTPPSIDLKVFVPAKDFAKSLAFYQDFGANLNWQGDGLAELEIGNGRFLLQDYYHKKWAENFMFQLVVDDIESWWKFLQESQILKKHPYIRARPPKSEPWGTVIYLWGPSGELWHITQPNAS